MVDIQTVSIVSAAIGVLIAAVNSILTSRRANQQRQTELETRQVELFMRLYEQWTSKELRQAQIKLVFQYQWKDFDDFYEKYGPTNPEEYISVQTLGSFYEGIGVLVERGIIDEDLAYDLIGGGLRFYWERFRELVTDHRKHFRPDMFDHTEMLYNRLKKISQQRQSTMNTQ